MSYYDFYGNPLQKAYDFYGNIIGNVTPTNAYEQKIVEAINSWNDAGGTKMMVHTDQHNCLRKLYKPKLSFVSSVVDWDSCSAILGLGDTTNYNVSAFEEMDDCLSVFPRTKRIDIWGNHDTWGGSRDIGGSSTVASDEEFENVLCRYFDNSAYPNNHRYNNYGIEYSVDTENHIKYVVLGGWEYDGDLGYHSHYVIGQESMDAIIEMLSTVDTNDIVILSHIQPFLQNKGHDTWTVPYEDGNTGDGLVSTNPNHTPSCCVYGGLLDALLIARKNKTSGTVRDSYGNVHSYDFTGCTSDLLCCFAGHEHCNWYNHQNGNIPVVIFDAYAYDTHPFYFVNVDRNAKNIHVWRVDETPQVVDWVIPFVI